MRVRDTDWYVSVVFKLCAEGINVRTYNVFLGIQYHGSFEAEPDIRRKHTQVQSEPTGFWSLCPSPSGFFALYVHIHTGTCQTVTSSSVDHKTAGNSMYVCPVYLLAHVRWLTSIFHVFIQLGQQTVAPLQQPSKKRRSSWQYLGKVQHLFPVPSQKWKTFTTTYKRRSAKGKLKVTCAHSSDIFHFWPVEEVYSFTTTAPSELCVFVCSVGTSWLWYSHEW